MLEERVECYGKYDVGSFATMARVYSCLFEERLSNFARVKACGN